MKSQILIWALLLVFTAGCSGISMLSSPSRDDLYSSEFLTSVEGIKRLYSRGEKEKALSVLRSMNDQKMLPTERAQRRNLMGVVYFSLKNFEQAIFNFKEALGTSRLDENLTAQIYLNLASSHYKMGLIDKSYANLLLAEFKFLKGREAEKYFKLRYKLAIELGKDRDAVLSLLHFLGKKKKISDFKNDPLYEQLMSQFVKWERREKYKIFEEFEESKSLIIGFLAFSEAEKIYYTGNKDEADDLLSWVEKYFGKLPEVRDLIKNFNYRKGNYTKVDPYAIGVLLPLTGDKKNFAKRAMIGIDAALQELKKHNKDIPFKIIMRDSQGSGVVGAQKVKELVENHFVSTIIGGLFSSEAIKEYKSAKRLGAFFISLSQIYLPKEKKDHLLLEIPGSIESQISEIFSQIMLEKFGNKAAILYPRSQRGEAYVEEFWRRAKLANVKVSEVLSYEKNKSDFRDPIKNLLGLKYIRARQEEYDILNEIYGLEKRKSLRRLQVLKPQVDFDWIFIPSYPFEAMQIIPSFTYFDAFNVNLIGGPSWRSKRLSRESYKFKNIHFIGEDVQNIPADFSKWFIDKYKRRPGLIELRSFDSFKIAVSLTQGESVTTRDEIDILIKTRAKLEGYTGLWDLKDGVWLKEMTSLHLKNGKVKKVFIDGNEPATQGAQSN
jgi:hypothetical protein